MRLVLHPKVYSDIDEIMGYYERVATPGLAEEFYTELRYFMTEAADKPIHLLDPDDDRSLPEFEECRLEWSWILIGTSGGGDRDSESVQAS
jgi:hypothetical protein